MSVARVAHIFKKAAIMTPGGKLLQAAVRQTHDPVARVAARNKEAPCLLFVAFRATWFAVFGVVSLLAELPGSPSSLFARLELVPLADLGRVCTRCGAGVPHSAVRVADRTSRHSAVCRRDATAHVCRQPSRRPTSRHTWQGEPPPRHGHSGRVRLRAQRRTLTVGSGLTSQRLTHCCLVTFAATPPEPGEG